MDLTTNTVQRFAYVLPLDVEIDKVLATVEAYQKPARVELVAVPAASSASNQALVQAMLSDAPSDLPGIEEWSYDPTLDGTVDPRHYDPVSFWPAQPTPRFKSSAWSKLPTTKRWAIRYQGSITAQQWELLMSPWKLDEHHFQQQLRWCEFVNNYRARRLTKAERRRLNRARRRTEGA